MSGQTSSAPADNVRRPDRITRHRAFDRLGHWLMAACVLVLLATAFLPIAGVQFAWVDIHWMTGLLLCALVLLHIVRSVLLKPLLTMLPVPRDIADSLAVLRFNLRVTRAAPPLPGKYSVAQKSIHAVFACVILAALVTGGFLLAKTDTPWWERNPYVLSDDAWGIVNVIHGFAALLLITLVMVHVYFALRPEKWHYLRSMIFGVLTRAEYAKHHDAQRWRVEE